MNIIRYKIKSKYWEDIQNFDEAMLTQGLEDSTRAIMETVEKSG